MEEQLNEEKVEQSKTARARRQLDDRRYLPANLLLGLFVLFLMLLSLLSTLVWPPKRRARITVVNNTDEKCYVAALSTDTDNYGTYGKHICLQGEESVYWKVLQAYAEDNGMSEEEAEKYVRDKKAETALSEPGEYAIEMYRELMDAFSAYERGQATHIMGLILHGYVDGNAEDYPTYEIWKGIAAFKDADGYRYIHQVAEKANTGTTSIYRDEYDMPEKFKLLMYWPESGKYAVSGVWERTKYLSEYRVTAETLPGNETGVLQVEDISKRETIPIWLILVVLAAIVGGEVLSAWLLGAREKRQLLTITVVSTALHTVVFAVMVLTRQVLIVNGQILSNAILFWFLLFVVIPVIEMPIYVNTLRERGKFFWLKYKYCEFTLYINWAVLVVYMGIFCLGHLLAESVGLI